jgi:hypothetical protein
MSPGAQNVKMVTGALGTVENESGRAKLEKRDTTPSILPKTSLVAQNMKTGPDALGTAENVSGRTKREYGTRSPQYRRKRLRARKT